MYMSVYMYVGALPQICPQLFIIFMFFVFNCVHFFVKLVMTNAALVNNVKFGRLP